ncbi:MAG: ArnT family glycosyltransferase [Aureispira sp.]
MAVNRTRTVGIVIGINVLLAAIWWLVPLWMYGVFDDGMFYGSIARNLVYDAQESIWDLKVTNTLDPKFNGHPPLNFWLQAFFFKLLGDVYWVERIYSFVLAMGAMGLLVACWRLWEKDGARLGLLFWLSISIVGWSFGNNLLENLLTVCTVAAVYFLVLAAHRPRQGWFFVFLSGCCIVAAVLTKGPVGLYPLAAPIGYAFIVERSRWKRAIVETLFLCFLVVASYFLLITISPRASVFFERYWELQLVGSLTGQDSLAVHRFYILQALIEESLPALLVGLFLQRLVHYFKLATSPINKKAVLFWLWMGVCASLPLLISPKQLRFYIVPAMGWYALAWGIFNWPVFLALIEHTKTWKRSKMLLAGLVWLGVSGCLLLSFYNKGDNARQTDLLNDTKIIGGIMPSHSTLHILPSLYNKWNLHAYFYRYYYIDLTTVYQEQKYVAVPKGAVYDRSIYKKEVVGLKTLDLYKRQY